MTRRGGRGGGLLVVLAACLWLAALGRDGVDRWVAATVLPGLSPATGTEVLARDGRLLRPYMVADGRWRLAVDPATVDPGFLAMLITYEDRRFATHPGVDLVALLRAAGQSLLAGRVVSGGSTLTMQVARLIEDSGTGRLPGKLRQIRVALALERRLSKAQILQLYLHLAPYGGNIEGVRAASLAWFGREPSRLTPAQAALLVALPQAPEVRRPDRAADAARHGRDRVLQRAETAGLIAADAARAARAEPVPATRRAFPMLAPHLADRLVAENPGLARISTTLDATLQHRLEVLATEAVALQGDRLQVALMVADHRSGDVLASVGSAAYRADARQGYVDMTRALRSPGSTLKPLVYALAFDEGLAHPETLLEDRPAAFGTYAPQNFDRLFRGTVRAREALQLSLNIPVVALTEALGPERLMAALRRAGVQARLPGGAPGLAVALGGVGVTLEDLVQLYASLARGGVALPLQITRDGSGARPALPAPQPATAPPVTDRVVSAPAAWLVGDILAGLPPPPGSPANRLAYKTGTSYGHRDAWALGYDGRHVAGVWLGRADGTPVPGAFGGDLAAPILFQVISRIKPEPDPLPPPPPATLLVANTQLPQPLQRFRPRLAYATPDDPPQVAFPPAGAEVALDGGPLLVRVRGGIAPFTWLADGEPLAIADPGRESILHLPRRGSVTLSVIDARGLSARAEVQLLP